MNRPANMNRPFGDMRVMTLKRLNSPFAFAGGPETISEYGKYVSFNNYHYIDIDPLPNGMQPSLSSAYKVVEKHRRRIGDSDVHIMQSMVLCGEHPEFWRRKSDLLYITMVQFSDHELVTRETFEAQVQKACEKATKNGKAIRAEQWCVYYSLDFCDAIIFVRNCSFGRYQDMLWDLSVDLDGQPRLVIDTISIYGINSKKVISDFRQFMEGVVPLYPSKKHEAELFDLAFFLGVQNATVWNVFRADLENKYGPLKIYRKFGRTDITVTFDRFDIENTLYIFWLAFFKEHNGLGSGFGSCIISPRATHGTTHEAPKDLPTLSPYEKDTLSEERRNISDLASAERVIKALYNEANPKLQRLYKPLSGYCTDIHNSLLAMLKSSFSEEYYISVLPSYAAHLRFIVESLKKIDYQRQCDSNWREQADNLVEALREYYRGLIMLEHSTLHGEKKFIQAPALNAFVCEIPPKLLALYTALAFRITKRLNDNGKLRPGQLYAPLFVPDFRQDMYSRTITHDQKSLTQIGIIYLEEQLFYEPEYAIPSMVHEIAHKVGNRGRHRDERAKHIFRCIAIYLLACELPQSKLDSCWLLIDQMVEKLAEMLYNACKILFNQCDGFPYLDNIRKFLVHTSAGGTLLREEAFATELVRQWGSIESKAGLETFLESQDDIFNSDYLSSGFRDQRKALAENTFFSYLIQRMIDRGEKSDNNMALAMFCSCLLSGFSESYSDLRMLETVGYDDKGDAYRHLLELMFNRKNFEHSEEESTVIASYYLREDAICRVFGFSRVAPLYFNLDQMNIPTKFIIQRTQDELVHYLQKCHLECEADETVVRFMDFNAIDFMTIHTEIRQYRKDLKAYFEAYEKEKQLT